MPAKIRILILAELAPAWAAGGKQRKILPGFQTLQKFLGFLHNGQVCPEVRIIDLVKPDTAQGCRQFSGGSGTPQILP